MGGKENNKKQFILLIFLFFVFFAAVGFMANYMYVDRIENLVRSTTAANIEKLTVNKAKYLDERIRSEQLDLQFLAVSIEKQQNSMEAIELAMEYLPLHEATCIWLRDKQGQEWCSESDSSLYPPEREDELFLPALRGRTGISEIFKGKFEEYQIMFYSPIYQNGIPVGAVYEAYPIQLLRDTYKAASDYDLSYSYVLEKNGDIVFGPIHFNHLDHYTNFRTLLEESGNTSSKINNFFDALNSKAAGSAVFSFGTENQFLYFLPLEQKEGWYFVTATPLDRVEKDGNTIIAWTVRMVFTLILVVAFAVTAGFTALKYYSRKKDENQRYIQMLCQSMSQNTDTVIFIVGKKDRKVEYVFENAGRLLGIPAEKFYTDNETEPNELFYEIKHILRYEQPKSRKVLEIQSFNRALGQTMWLSVICCPIILGKEEKYLFALTDLTEERLIRRALSEAATAASQANEAKSRFLSNMSHDIRTPMNAIIGFVTLAEKNLDNKEKVQDYLKKILSSGNILLDLINDVLDMSRIESGKMKMEEVESNLPEIFNELQIMVAEQMKAKQLHLEMDTSKTENPDVYCDSLHLKQMIMNLLSNAIKFTPEGGNISITLSQKTPVQNHCAMYEIRVKDSGIGMSQEFVQRVFEAFEREVNSTVNKIQGTGLGMAITKGILEMMNGTIEVETEQGKGTEFIINLSFRIWEKPLSEPIDEKPEDSEENHSNFTGKRILLAEDNELNREIATEILTEYGFEVETAENGKLAVEKLAQSKAGFYDLILMDVQMPVMNGHEATKAIRKLEDQKLARTAIVAMTANAFDEDRNAAIECGMDGFISKPIDIEELIRIFKDIFHNHTSSL